MCQPLRNMAQNHLLHRIRTSSHSERYAKFKHTLLMKSALGARVPQRSYLGNPMEHMRIIATFFILIRTKSNQAFEVESYFCFGEKR